MRRSPAEPLPTYAVRVSDRAKRIRLTVSPRDGIVVVVPRKADVRGVPDLLHRHAEWLAKAEARVAERREHLLSDDGGLPRLVEAPAFGLRWQVAEGSSSGPATVRESHGTLTVSGGDTDDQRRAALQRWLARTARRLLVPRLLELAEAEGLEVSRVQVRSQRTRWGSCSRSGSISLNRDLVFLPDDLVRYVLLHEIVHLQVPDHSPRFWKALERVEPEARRLRRALRDAWRFVPPWAAAGGVPGGGEEA